MRRGILLGMYWGGGILASIMAWLGLAALAGLLMSSTGLIHLAINMLLFMWFPLGLEAVAVRCWRGLLQFPGAQYKYAVYTAIVIANTFGAYGALRYILLMLQ